MAAELAEDAWKLLHDVRLRGTVQGPESEQTAALVEAGYAVRRGSATVITSAGRSAHADWARLVPGSEEEAAVRRAYERFLDLDLEMKQLTTEWQTTNTAAPAAGLNTVEWKVIDRLVTLDERAGPLLSALGKAVPRFAGYRPRLKQALSRLEDGERHWFSGISCDSYHMIWWRLHEDLLVALGISRSEDPNQ